MSTHDGRAESDTGRPQVAAEQIQDLARIRGWLPPGADGGRRIAAGDFRYMEHAPPHGCGVRLGFDSQRLPPRIDAIVRARRQQLSSRLTDITSKRGLVLFEGRAMTDAEARLRFRRLQGQHRGMVAEL